MTTRKEAINGAWTSLLEVLGHRPETQEEIDAARKRIEGVHADLGKLPVDPPAAPAAPAASPDVLQQILDGIEGLGKLLGSEEPPAPPAAPPK